MAPRASIVIRCRNEEEHIGRLLSGIFQQTESSVEVIVVDSGSTDATLAVASRFPVKILHIEPELFSFGRALNRGCAAAGGEFIVLASAHVYPVYRDWLEKLLAPFADPNVALSYGKQRGAEVTKYSEHRVFAQWFPEQSAPLQSHPFCNNANAAVRRSLWADMPYDEDMTGLEDIDWARRAIARGFHLSYAASAEVIHVHNETWRRLYDRYRREAIAMHAIFPHERFSCADFLRLAAGNTISDWAHAAQDGVFIRNAVAITRFRILQFWGTYRGFRHRGPIAGDLKQRFYYPQERRRMAERFDTPRDDGLRIDYTQGGPT